MPFIKKKKREDSNVKKIICLCLVLAALFCCAACTQEEQEKPTPTYAYQSGDVKIAIDADAAPILAALGEWRDYAESASCAFVGLDKVYTYAGFEIQTYPMNGKDYVYMVALYDDTVATPEGVRIGSSADAVVAAYGEASEQSATALIYRGDVVDLEFLLRDGAVTYIKYVKK